MKAIAQLDCGRLASTLTGVFASGLLLAFPIHAQAGRAFVSNEDGESVTVVDTERGEVLSTVNVGKRPRGLKLSHDGKQLFVAVSGSTRHRSPMKNAKLKRDLAADGVAVIDTQTLKVIKVLKAGSDPEQFDLSQDGRHLFISNEDTGTLSVLDV